MSRDFRETATYKALLKCLVRYIKARRDVGYIAVISY